jgi:hypothetical protein
VVLEDRNQTKSAASVLTDTPGKFTLDVEAEARVKSVNCNRLVLYCSILLRLV